MRSFKGPLYVLRPVLSSHVIGSSTDDPFRAPLQILKLAQQASRQSGCCADEWALVNDRFSLWTMIGIGVQALWRQTVSGVSQW